MARTVPTGRNHAVPDVIWEAHRVSLQMHMGGGRYVWQRIDDVYCVSGQFPKTFAALNIPGFAAYDPDRDDIERTLVYAGRNYPSDLGIQKYLQQELEERMAELRKQYATTVK